MVSALKTLLTPAQLAAGSQYVSQRPKNQDVDGIEDVPVADTQDIRFNILFNPLQAQPTMLNPPCVRLSINMWLVRNVANLFFISISFKLGGKILYFNEGWVPFDNCPLSSEN